MIKHENDLLYMQDSIDKQLQIAFDGGTITNKEIPSEQFSLTESLSSDGLMFGSCEASEVKFRIYNVFTPLKDKWLTVTQVLDKDYDNPLQIGKYKVYSDKPTADRSYRDVVAYDSMYDIINADVASWYNSLTFPMQLKTFRDSFFDYFGIDQEEVALVNDAMTIEKTIEPSVLSGKDVLQSICQINGCFGHIGRDGKMQYVFLNAIIGGLYPSNNIYPANDLYPQQPNINVLSKGLYVEPPTYEDYMVKPIDKLEIREKEGDIGVIVGSGNNAYVVEDNFLVYGKSTDDLTVIANNMLSVIDGLEYRPFDARLVGNPCFEVGDMVRLNTKHQIIDSYVLQRTLSGVQCLRDDFSAEGEEYQSEKVNDIQTDIKQLKGKSNTLERTIEETRSTIANVEEGLQSEISQTAESIRSEVSNLDKNFSSEIEQTAESIRLEVAEIDNDLSSRIEQTVKSISLKVNNGDSTAGIVITLTNEDGSTSEVTGTIDMTGLVTFTDLLTQGQTVINGSNITTGQINCDLLNGGTINGQTIKGGSIEGSYISGASIYADHLSATGASNLEELQLGATENIPHTVILKPVYGTLNPGLVDALQIDGEIIIKEGVTIGNYSALDYGATTDYLYVGSNNSAGLALRGGTVRLKNSSGTTVTSDERLKNSFKSLEEFEQSYMDLKPIAFKYNNGTSDRFHFGFGANQVRETLLNNGYTTQDFAGFVQSKDNPNEKDYCGVDDPMGLIYTEFVSWNTHMIQKAYKKIETQQQEIEELKKSVSFLMSKLGDDVNG